MLGRCVSGQGSSDDLSVTKNLSQIYTDWANYYLERAKSKRKVSDLSADCRDGLLLAEVIEAVTTFKVPDLVKKPKTPQHMVSTEVFFFYMICIILLLNSKFLHKKHTIPFTIRWMHS
uniref:Calponin-homology (CH) domain-containing protein n=1 Tax=Anopheles culicifacies TaxID=139723 RepID=A0A182MWX1_9DIPT